MTALLLCRFAQSAAAVLLGGTVVLRLLARGTNAHGDRSWNRLAIGSWAALVVSSALQLWLTAADMSDVPPGDALDAKILGNVLLGTRFGSVWRVRACLLGGLILLWSWIKRSARLRASSATDVAGAVLAAGVLASLVWSGHARASDHSAWLFPSDVVHVVAAGAWPGGLLPLALLLAKARREPRLVSSAVVIGRRFSNLSVVAVSAIAFSGLLNGCGLLGTFSALWSSVYGRLLLCKVAPVEQTIRLLWRNVIWECALAVGVLLATEALAMTAPPVGGR